MRMEAKKVIDMANENPFAKMLNITVQSMEEGSGEASIEITISPMHLNPMGTLHGGVISTLADVSMGLAIRTLGRIGVTVNLNTNFLAPGNLGQKIVARGKVVHQGNTLISTECTITREEENLAKSTGLWFVIK